MPIQGGWGVFTLDQLLCFRFVAEEGSLTAASKRLHRAKSAVRYHIEALEEQLGFSLFDRSGYRLSLSKRGERFLRRAAFLEEEAKELFQYAKTLESKVENHLSVSASAIFPIHALTNCLREIMRAYGQCELSFQREVLSGEELLLRGEVDIAVFEELQSREAIEAEAIGSVELPLYIGKHHPFTELPKEAQTLSRLKKYPQIVMRSTIQNQAVALNKALKHKSKWIVNDLGTKRNLIEEGLGWGRLPKHLVSQSRIQDKLQDLSYLGQNDKVTMYLGRRKKDALGPVGQHLWDLVFARAKDFLV